MIPTEIRNQNGERLDFTFRSADTDGRELIVIGHGVTANKDREWAVVLANAVHEAGMHTLRFSFSGNGASQGDFRDSCPTKEVADLGAVLDTTADWQITYIGHSMGAAVGVMRASSDPRIRRIISLGGMVDTAEFARRKFGDLVPGKSCMWEKPECPLSQKFMDDMVAIGSVEPLAAQLTIPWLLIHGTGDTVVPLAESERISSRAAGDVQQILLEGADHVFSGDAAHSMAEHVVTWLRIGAPGTTSRRWA